MNLGVSDAAHLFPRLLQIIEEYPATRDHFKTCSKELNGIWLLLPWLPQLVAVMDKSIASAVNPLVQAVCSSPCRSPTAFCLSYSCRLPNHTRKLYITQWPSAKSITTLMIMNKVEGNRSRSSSYGTIFLRLLWMTLLRNFVASRILNILSKISLTMLW